MSVVRRDLGDTDDGTVGACLLLFSIPAWMEDGLCAQADPEAFFPERGQSVRAAKATCRECPVRAECLEYALANGERFGVWGGLSERDRRKMHKEAS